MIIVDFNAICISNIFVQKMNLEEDLIRHMVLNSLRMYRTRFKKDYGELVIATDSRSWRKDYYPEYKAARKIGRQKSTMDWEKAFNIITMIREELKENRNNLFMSNFPVKKDFSMFVKDDNHPSPKGHKLIADKLLEYL